MTGELRTWTIYAHPRDYPEGYVVRGWTIHPGRAVADADAQTALTLEAARELVPPGLFRMPRQPGDDPAVLETWL